MLEILRLVRIVLEMLTIQARSLRVLLTPPLVTVGMLLVLYAGWHIRDEGSISAGLQVAFIDTTAFRVERARDVEALILQTEMHRAVESDALIDQLLTALLLRIPSAARARLAVIHNGVTGVTGMTLLRFDITNAVAAAGRAVGVMVSNEPLSEWNDFLAELLAGQCHFGETEAEANVMRRARLETLGAGSHLTCPVIDIQHKMLGAILVTWDLHNAPPGDAERAAMAADVAGIAVQIATALDLGHRLLPHLAAGDQ